MLALVPVSHRVLIASMQTGEFRDLLQSVAVSLELWLVHGPVAYFGV